MEDESQAKIYRMLVKTLKDIDEVYIASTKQLVEAQADHPVLMQKLLEEHFNIRTELLFRIEAHPLHAELSGK